MQIPFETKPIIKDWGFVVLLFYKYVHIEDPETFLKQQKAICEKLSIKGRFIIAHEGINITCEATPDSANEYIKQLTTDPRFADIHIKYSKGNGNAFPRLRIRVRPEIVTLRLGDEDVDPNKVTGVHLKPAELHEWFEKKNKGEDDFVIVDMRNEYEHQVGHFPESVLPPLKNFRDLPKVLPELEKFKGKKLLTVCTGGVRCEKASGYLKTKGFEDVYQLDGGMVSYMEQYPGQNFLGAMYSFDNRVVIDYDGGNHPVIGKCIVCGTASENVVDCKNVSCHGQVIECKDCLAKLGKVYCKDRCDMHLPFLKRYLNRLIHTFQK